MVDPGDPGGLTASFDETERKAEALSGRLLDLRLEADAFSRTMSRALTGAVVGGRQLDDVLKSLVLRLSDMTLKAALTPLTNGMRQQYNLQVSGGNDKVQFFVSGQTESENGIYKMPDSEVARLKEQRGVSQLPGDIMRPNALGRNSFRANVNAELRPNLFIQASSGFVNSSTRLPQNEDNANGLMVAALGGPWRQDLRDAVMVAQVDEQQAAMIAHAMDPAGNADGAADIGLPQCGAGMAPVTMHGMVFRLSEKSHGHGVREAAAPEYRPEKRMGVEICQGERRRGGS